MTRSDQDPCDALRACPSRPGRRWLVALVAALLCAPALDAAQSTLIARGAEWRYLDDGSDQGTAWRDLSFDDQRWASGPAHLGYGDRDERTTVGFGADPQQKFITTYFRHQFEVADPSSIRRLDLALVRDDGAVVYLNGFEVFRSNLPSTPITFDTPASEGQAGSQEDLLHYASVDPARLQAGRNVLAVEVHQVAPTSSDISFDLELRASDSPLIVTRGPYLQLATPSSMVIRWRTDPATDSQVRYSTLPEDLDQVASSAELRQEHELHLSGLQAGSTYYYRVGSSEEPTSGLSPVHRFTTPPQPGQRVPRRVWILGDSGTSDLHAARVRDAYLQVAQGQVPDLWLMLGDNAYDRGTDNEYQAALFAMYPHLLASSVLWPTLGNHDGRSADSATQSGVYYDLFTLPRHGEAGGQPSGTEAYYSFDHGNIHFICLESFETDRSPTSPMMTWLEDDIASTDADWVVAFWHHPPYSKGSHDSDQEVQLIEMREHALPILEDYGVDLVLAGHSHSYERSALIDGHYGSSDTLHPSMVLDGGSGDPTNGEPYRKASRGPAPHQGAVYIVAGSSGKVSAPPGLHPVMVYSEAVLGSVILDVHGLELSASFVDDQGQTRDLFAIVKQGGNLIFEDDFESGATDSWP